jgi:hypothetical protein
MSAVTAGAAPVVEPVIALTCGVATVAASAVINTDVSAALVCELEAVAIAPDTTTPPSIAAV